MATTRTIQPPPPTLGGVFPRTPFLDIVLTSPLYRESNFLLQFRALILSGFAKEITHGLYTCVITGGQVAFAPHLNYTREINGPRKTITYYVAAKKLNTINPDYMLRIR